MAGASNRLVSYVRILNRNFQNSFILHHFNGKRFSSSFLHNSQDVSSCSSTSSKPPDMLGSLSPAMSLVNLSTDSSSSPPLIVPSYVSILNPRMSALRVSPLVTNMVLSMYFNNPNEWDVNEFGAGVSVDDTKFTQFLQHSPFLVDNDTYVNDSVRSALLKCVDVESVCSVVRSHQDKLTIVSAGTALGKLWNILLAEELTRDKPDVDASCTANLNNIMPVLIDVIDKNYNMLDIASVVTLLTQLRSFGISTENRVVNNMYVSVMDKKECLSLDSLTRVLLLLASPELNYHMKGKFLPIVEKYIDSCETPEDLLLLSYCISSANSVASGNFISRYATKVNELLDTGVIQDIHSELLFNILQYHQYSVGPEVFNLVRKIGQMISQRNTPFSFRELAAIKVFCRSDKLNRHLQNRLYEDSLRHVNEIADDSVKIRFFLNLAPKDFNEKKMELEQITKNLLNSQKYQSHFLVLYYALRKAGFSNFSVMNDYWNKSLSHVLDVYKNLDCDWKRESVLSQVYIRYMKFNNNLGGTYRHEQLEQEMLKTLIKEIDGVSGLLVSKLTRMMSFIIAYSPPGGIPQHLIHKLINITEQLDLENVLILSNGLQVSLSLNARCNSDAYALNCVPISHMLLDATKRVLKTPLSSLELTKLFRCAITFQHALHKFAGFSIIDQSSYAVSAPKFTVHNFHRNNKMSRVSYSMSSDALLSEIYGIMSSNINKFTPFSTMMLAHCIPSTNISSAKVLDSLLELTAAEADTTCGVVAARVLFSCFYHGHTPSVDPSVMHRLSHVITEEAPNMFGMVLLHAAIALCYFDFLPPPLVNSIFNVNFMDQLDTEIQNCTTKRMYPLRIRKVLMELNRSVCISHPDACVPWFHEQYCKDLSQTKKHTLGGFMVDVKSALVNLLGSSKYISENVYSPYYHFMNFEFVLDRKGEPVLNLDVATQSSLPKSTVKQISTLPGHSRYSVVLLNPNQFVTVIKEVTAPDGSVTMHRTKNILGWHSLVLKELECLGYNVICIPRTDWQSMALSTMDSKLQYLRNKINNPNTGIQ